MNNQIVLPDTPTSLLELFSTSKEGITLFASKVINEIEAGNVNPLKAKLWCKTLTEIADKIDKATKEHQVREAAKFGDKPFQFAGAELHLTATYTEYDYESCNDSVYQELVAAALSANNKKKEREAFLRTVREPLTVIDSLSGEMVTITPPIKKVTEGVKVSIK